MTLTRSREGLPKIAVGGALIAIAITTAMDATGLSDFSALPLFPLMIALWLYERLSRRDIGFVIGKARYYAVAVGYPVMVIGLLTLLASAAGAVDTSQTDWNRSIRDLLLITVTTIIVASITEEGFFRGWMWASFTKGGSSAWRTLATTSVAFSLWHLSAVSLETGFDLPARQIPLFMVNAALMGAAWGILRLVSGSVLVASVSHGLWNGLVYTLFAFGTRTGALGVTETAIYGPEVGFAGLLANLVAVLLLWRWVRRAIVSAHPHP